jgi:hypothetical protein
MPASQASQITRIFDAKPSFAAGELSPSLAARVDMAQYAIGAKFIENFIVLPQGGLVNRPGTEASIPLGPFTEACLIPFSRAGGESFTILVCRNGNETAGTVLYAFAGTTLIFSSAILGAFWPDLKKLRWLQSNDVLFLFHPDTPVQTLSYRPGESMRFRLEAFNIKNGPFRDTNTDEDKKCEVRQISSGEYLIYPYFEAFVPAADCVGELFKITQKVESASGEITLKKGSTEWSILADVFGAFTWRTSGKWIGEIVVQQCVSENHLEGTVSEDWVWEDFKTYKSDSGAEENFSFSGTVEEYSTLFRFKVGDTDLNKDVSITWSFDGGVFERVFRITSVFGENALGYTMVSAKSVDRINGSVEATDEWAFGAFGKRTGYPSLGAFHQERLVLARTNGDPETVWMSKPAAWNDFGTSLPAKDDDSISFTLASKDANEIRGLASRGDLLLFTASGEWTAKAGAKTDVFTPSSIVVTPSGYRGSHTVPPIEVGDVTFFVQRHGTVIRSIGYSLESDGYVSSDMSILSSHLFANNPVVAWAYQQSPWSVVWAVLKDGTIAALTFQREHQVAAWTRQKIQPWGTDVPKVLDVCCVSGESQDDVFFLVARDFSGENPNGQLYIAKLKPRGNENDIFTDEARAGGAGEADKAAAVVSTLECLDLEIPAGNTLQGRYKHIPAVTFRLMETRGIKAGFLNENTDDDGERLDTIQFPDRESPGYRSQRMTGDVRMIVPGGTARQARLKIVNDIAAPVTILGVFPELRV